MSDNGPSTATAKLSVIRPRELTPFWGSVKNDKPGHMRWFLTPVGGPEGFWHANRGEPGVVETTSCTAGLLVLPAGMSSPGLHVHENFDEIYVVTQGSVAVLGQDGQEALERHDWAFVPAGVRHGVRNVGLEDAHIIFFQSGAEREGFQTGSSDSGNSSWLDDDANAVNP